MKLGQSQFRLGISLEDAFAFAMGWTDLDCPEANDRMRQVLGLIVVDRLQYSEEWRASAQARKCLEEKWPELFSA